MSHFLNKILHKSYKFISVRDRGSLEHLVKREKIGRIKLNTHSTSIVLAAPSVMANGQEYKPEEGENRNSFTA